MRKFILIAFLLTSISFVSKAQMYTSAVGLRMGLEGGITLKHFNNEKTALEGILSTRWHGINATGLYEIHALAFDIDGLFWYYGGGVHIGLGSSFDNNFAAGIDGVIGIEYTIRDYPINISLDWKPAVNVIGGYNQYWGTGTALSIRYVFK